MKPTFFKGVVLGAVIAAVVSAGAVGFGAVTPFNLNTTANTVSAPTAASGSIAGNQFTLTDNSTSAGAPLALTNNSTAAGATALKLAVKSGKAPFTVNSGTKVANLNADRVDGIDSTGLVQGKGRTYNLAVAITRATGTTDTEYVPSPAVAPGFFNVSLLCPGTSRDVQPFIKIYDLAVSAENVFGRNDFYSDAFGSATLTTGSPIQISTDRLGDLTTVTVNGLPGGVQTTSWLQIATVRHANDCYFQIQALTTHQ
jgi:hypothetical protein